MAFLQTGAFLLVAAALPQPVPALSHAQDTVMSDAFRCGVIGDSRSWLDCYYGAAQPVRALLRLPPAPEKQAQLLAALPSASPAPHSDQLVRDEVMIAAVRCVRLGNGRVWLDCYYSAARPMRVHLGLLAPDQVPAPVPTPAPAHDEVVRAAPGQGTPAALPSSARMAAYSFSKDGWFTVTLDNGEQWRQSSGDTNYAHWKGPPAQYVVQISHGFMHSFNLHVKGLAGVYKVTRIR